MRTFLALVAIALTGCHSEQSTSAPETVSVASEAPPVMEHAYNHNLSTEASVIDWRAGIENQVNGVQQDLFSPDEYFEIFPSFKQGIDVWVGSTDIWNLPAANLPSLPSDWFFDGPDPTIGVAQAYEDNDEEYKAGQYWLALGRTQDAQRCMRALLLENEWAASGMLAVYLEDEGIFSASVQGLIDDDRTTDLNNLFSAAMHYGHLDWVWAAVQAQSWEIEEVIKDHDALAEAAIAAGDQDLLIRIIESDLRYWTDGENRYDDSPKDRTVMLLVSLASVSDHDATDLARRYLSSIDPLIVSYEDGYNSRTHVVRGTFKLWELVSNDPELAQLYQSHVRDWFYARYQYHPETRTDHDEGEDVFGGFASEWSSSCLGYGCGGRFNPNVLFTYMRRSRQYGGLSNMWLELLNGLDLYCYGEARNVFYEKHRRPVFIQQFGRAVLDEPYDPDLFGLTPGERFLLKLSSGETRPEYLVEVWKEFYRNGRGWVELELLLRLLIQGEISDADMAAVVARIEEYHPDKYGRWLHFRSFVLHVFEEDMADWSSTHRDLVASLGLPVRTLAENQLAHNERHALGLSGSDVHGLDRTMAGVVDTEQEVRAILDPVLTDVRERAPWAYTRFIDNYSQWALPEVIEANDMANPGQ